MTTSNPLDQVLAFLPKAERRSTIYVFPGEQTNTWGVAIAEKENYRIPFWSELQEDPTSSLQQYITANPDQQLRMVTLTQVKRLTCYADFRLRVLSSKVIDVLASSLRKRLSTRLTDLLTVLLLEICLGLLGLVIWLLTGVPRAPRAELWGAWGCLFTALSLFLVKSNLDRFLQVVEKHAGVLLGEGESAFQNWLMTKFSIHRQVIFSIVFAVVFLPLTFMFFAATIGREALLFVSFILFFNLLLIGNGLYWVIVLPGAAKTINENAQRTYCFDPRSTIWIDDLSDIYQRSALSTSIIGVAAVAPIVAGPSSTVTIQSISFGWFVLVWILVIIPYFYAQSYLSNLIRREHLLTLTTIQTRIYGFLVDGKGADCVDRAEKLLQLYTQAQSAERSVWRLGASLKFINSLLLPLLYFIVVNISAIVGSLEQLVRFVLR
jgi:hypothetical protein